MPFVIPFESFVGGQKGELCLSGAKQLPHLVGHARARKRALFLAPGRLRPQGPRARHGRPYSCSRATFPEPAPVDRSAGMEINFLHYRMRHVAPGRSASAGSSARRRSSPFLTWTATVTVSSFIENSGNGAVDDGTMRICRGLRFDQVGPRPDPDDVQAMKNNFPNGRPPARASPPKRRARPGRRRCGRGQGYRAVITVDFSTLVFICVFVPVGVVLGLWLRRERLSAKSISFLDDEEVFRCNYLHARLSQEKRPDHKPLPALQSYN